MNFTGMILKYDATQGVGTIMMSNGSKKDFLTADWDDTSLEPIIHQKITYESMTSPMHIKVLVQEPVKEVAPKESTLTGKKNIFANLDEAIKYFTTKSFKVIRDIQDETSRTLTLRSFSVEEFAEAIITVNGSKINIKHTCNGKPVLDTY